jgi:hypothetical protein
VDPYEYKDANCGGHAVLLISYSTGIKDHLMFANSWGIDFADGGFFRLESEESLPGLAYYHVYGNEE